jgi:hypothetical protein
MDDVRVRNVTTQSRFFGEHFMRVGLTGDMRQHTLEHDDPRLAGRPRFERTKHLCHSTYSNAIDESEFA